MPRLVQIETWFFEIIHYSYSELFQKKGFFKDQNAGFTARIYRVTLTKTCFLNKDMGTRSPGVKNLFRYNHFLAQLHAYIQLISYKRNLECTLVQWRLSIYA